MSWKNKISYRDIGIVIVLVVALVFAWYNAVKREELLALPQIYVIGEVIEKNYPARGEPIITFSYVLNRVKYYREESNSLVNKVRVGDRFFVSVPVITDDRGYVKDVDKGFILLDQPVPDSVLHVPLGGWEELPVKIDK